MSLSLITEILVRYHARRGEPNTPYSDYLKIIDSRTEVLHEFQPIFAAAATITESDFRRFLEMKNNRHWTGLHRPAANACDDMPRLRKSLLHLLDESVEISARIDSLTGAGDLSIRGLDTGILTPILLVRYPDRYGVWNGKSEAALKALHIWPKLPRGTTKGQRYVSLIDLFTKLSDSTGLDRWTLDGLWHVVNEASQLEAELAILDCENEERDFFEGKQVATSGIRAERNSDARQKCLERKGYDCAVCGFNFFKRYGELGLNFIHVHHVNDLALVQGERKIDPENGLVPVCPNCHAMLHKGVKKSRSLADLRERLRDEA